MEDFLAGPNNNNNNNNNFSNNQTSIRVSNERQPAVANLVAGDLEEDQMARPSPEAANLKRDESVGSSTGDPHGTEEEEEKDTLVLDILSKRPALEAAQFEMDEGTAMTRDWKEKQDLSQETNLEDYDEKIVADQASWAVVERLNSKEDLRQEKSTTASNNLMQLAVEINEAAKLEKFAILHARASTSKESTESNFSDNNNGTTNNTTDSAVTALANGNGAQISNTPQSHQLSFFPKGRTAAAGVPAKGSATAQTLEADKDLEQECENTAINNVMQMAMEIIESAKVEKYETAANSRNAANSTEQGVGLNCQCAELEAVLPPIPLQRQQHQPSRPGAYLGLPGEALQRATTLQYSLVGADATGQDGPLVQIRDPGDSSALAEPHNVGQPSNSNIPSTNDPYLAVANLVVEDPEDEQTRPSADPVNLQHVQQREEKRKKQRLMFMLFFLLLLIVAAVIVGAVAGTQKRKEPEVLILQTTEAPTVYGSMEPTRVPSTAPTGALDLLLDTLPHSTVARINNGSGFPQWKAWQWLANHQNITFLPEWRKVQLFSLATFFYAFEGENWNHLIKGHGWMDYTVEECDWFSSGFGWFEFDESYIDFQTLGLTFTRPCNSQGQFTFLHLQDLQLSGRPPFLPPEIALLTSLSFVDFSSNDIAGPISSLLPTELYEMTGLTHLSLSGNQCTGKIPSEISLLTSLSYLHLGLNQFSGPFPSELGLLTSLEELWIYWNQLTGPVPSELGLLTSLDQFSLSANQLTGPFPSELGLLTSLCLLSLPANLLTGVLPSELGLLTSLDELSIYQNKLTGPVPSEFGALTALTTLWLNGNQFTGQIPMELWLLTSLSELDLYDNQFTGTIPTEVGMMTSLTSLALHNNSFTGTLPGQLKSSKELRLYGNQFSGTVPEHLCSFLWCDCSQNETPPVSTCADLIGAPPDWPGRFPSTGLAIMLNIYTDDWPEETSWVWQKETNVTGTWDTLESGGPLALPYYLYSSLFPSVGTNNSYRLVVSDSGDDGFFVPGWIALTATNQAVLYSSKVDGEAFVLGGGFSEITIGVLVGADGSVDLTNSMTL